MSNLAFETAIIHCEKQLAKLFYNDVAGYSSSTLLCHSATLLLCHCASFTKIFGYHRLIHREIREFMFKFLDPGKLIEHELELILIEKRPGNPVLNYVPAYRFKMMDTVRNVEMGAIDLRIGNTQHIVMYGGHIGYSVFPPLSWPPVVARGVACCCHLRVLDELGTLWITCNPDNFASRRSCELAGLELVEIVDLPPDTDMYQEGEREKCRYRLFL